MKIKRFYESTETFIPLKDEKRIYYKLHVDNSIRKLDVILNKLEIRKMFYTYFGNDIESFRQYIDNNAVIYLLINFYENDYELEIVTDESEVSEEDDRFYKRKYGGEIYATDYEVSANKYNI